MSIYDLDIPDYETTSEEFVTPAGPVVVLSFDGVPSMVVSANEDASWFVEKGWSVDAG